MAVKRWKVGVAALTMFALLNGAMAGAALLSGVPFSAVLAEAPRAILAQCMFLGLVAAQSVLMWWVLKDKGGDS